MPAFERGLGWRVDSEFWAQQVWLGGEENGICTTLNGKHEIGGIQARHQEGQGLEGGLRVLGLTSLVGRREKRNLHHFEW